MGLFDWLKKPKAPDIMTSLPQLCYDVAYFILPHYAFNDLTKLADLCLKTPTAAGPFFYVMATQMKKIEPVAEDAKRFTWHHGTLGEGREYFLLEYPVPPPVEMNDAVMEAMARGQKVIVLAPHFSLIIRGKSPEYFILGQAPMGGGTTLRCIQADGANCNLGPGPRPDKDAFLSEVKKRVVK